jgi:hypothetical protein
MQLHNTIVIPVAIYASETWEITEGVAQKLCVPSALFTQNSWRQLSQPSHE